MTIAYRRVLIKLSGEGLAGEDGFGINPAVIGGIAEVGPPRSAVLGSASAAASLERDVGPRS